MKLYTLAYIKEVITNNLEEFNKPLNKELIDKGEKLDYITSTSTKAFDELNELIESSSLHEFEAWEIIREPILFK